MKDILQSYYFYNNNKLTRSLYPNYSPTFINANTQKINCK